MKKSLCIIFLFIGISLSAQDIAIKTNLLYDISTTINLGAEFRLAPKWTLDLSANYNPFTFSDSKKWKHWMAQPEVVHGKPDSVFNLFRGGVKTGKGRLSGVLLCERKDRRGQCLRAGCNESGKRRRNFHFAEAGRKWYDDRNCKIRLEIGKRTGKGVQDR